MPKPSKESRHLMRTAAVAGKSRLTSTSTQRAPTEMTMGRAAEESDWVLPRLKRETRAAPRTTSGVRPGWARRPHSRLRRSQHCKPTATETPYAGEPSTWPSVTSEVTGKAQGGKSRDRAFSTEPLPPQPHTHSTAPCSFRGRVPGDETRIRVSACVPTVFPTKRELPGANTLPFVVPDEITGAQPWARLVSAK